MKVLIVKLSSMGDLVHLLPALSDAQAAIPNIRFDWVADEAFAEIPTWHPAVKQVIPSAHRRWKKNWRHFFSSGEARAFYRMLNEQGYDKVIDAQASLKSALVTRLVNAARHGMDKQSVREYGAHWFYQHQHRIAKNQHATLRLRQLLSAALGYELDASKPNYQLQLPQNASPDSNYLVFVPNASWRTKLWPDNNWLALLQLASPNYTIYIPSGSADEYQRAQGYAKDHTNVIALERQSLTSTANLIKHARGVVSCDTGLGHIAAAVNTPCVSLYGPTDTALIGALGDYQHHQVNDSYPCRPCYKKQCMYQQQSWNEAQCMLNLNAAEVWSSLLALIDQKDSDLPQPVYQP